MTRILRKLPLGLAIVASAGVGGCWEYLDHRDTVSTVAGDAIAVNKATQTIERWPDASRHDRWKRDGELSRIAVERYRTQTVIPPQPIATGNKKAEGPAAAPPPPPASGGGSSK